MGGRDQNSVDFEGGVRVSLELRTTFSVILKVICGAFKHNKLHLFHKQVLETAVSDFLPIKTDF